MNTNRLITGSHFSNRRQIADNIGERWDLIKWVKELLTQSEAVRVNEGYETRRSYRDPIIAKLAAITFPKWQYSKYPESFSVTTANGNVCKIVKNVESYSRYDEGHRWTEYENEYELYVNGELTLSKSFQASIGASYEQSKLEAEAHSVAYYELSQLLTTLLKSYESSQAYRMEKAREAAEYERRQKEYESSQRILKQKVEEENRRRASDL